MKSCRQLSLVLSLIAVLAACGTPGAPLPPSLELPQRVKDLRATRKGDKVYLSWTVPSQTTDLQQVRFLGPTRICRGLQVAMSQCGAPVGEIPASGLKAGGGQGPDTRIDARYADTLPAGLQSQNPTALLSYAVETMNDRGRSAGLSNQVQVPAAGTLPPPADFKAESTAEGVVLTWSGMLKEHEVPSLRHYDRVYRRAEGTDADTVVGDVQPGTSSEARLLDPSFEWEKNYEYRVTVVTVVSQPEEPEIQVEGDDTPILKFFAHDVFAPATPSGVEAVFSGAGQKPFVDLTWAPNTESDLAGYNLYRHDEGAEPGRINAELVKTPAYRDAKVIPGKTYFYSVTAVDLRGNESERSVEASESAPSNP
jgi:hypothetical protein